MRLAPLPLLLALRPVRIRGVGFITPAVLLNWAAVALFDLVVVVALGPRALSSRCRAVTPRDAIRG